MDAGSSRIRSSDDGSIGVWRRCVHAPAKQGMPAD